MSSVFLFDRHRKSIAGTKRNTPSIFKELNPVKAMKKGSGPCDSL